MRTALLATCVYAPIACSSEPTPSDSDSADGASVGGGHVGDGTGGMKSSAGGSSNSGGKSQIELPNSGGSEGEGSGGQPSVQDGGHVPLTAEQVTAIEMAECADVSGEADKLPAALQFVVDVSGSMGFDGPTTNGVPKWDIVLPALLSSLDSVEDHFAVGLQLFPTADVMGGGGPMFPPPGSGGASGTGGATGGATFEPSDYCADASGRVDIAEMGMAGSAHRMLLENTLSMARLPIGTPTHDGYVNALEESLKPYPSTGNKFMILMTDGQPTQEVGCGPGVNEGVDPAPIIAAVAAAYAEGISTFIIGSPGTEGVADGETAQPGESATDTRPWLSEAAMVGGTGPEGCSNQGPNFCHLDMTQAPDFGTALSEALAQIAEKVEATCSFQVPPVEGEEIDPARTNVMIKWSDGSSDLVLNDNVGDCTQGWTWGAAGEIQLCAETCAGIEADPDAIVAVSLGCTPDEIIVK